MGNKNARSRIKSPAGTMVNKMCIRDSCTGVLAMIPLCMEAKLSGRKLIYIESFAKVTSATLTGKLLYHYADRFYVQWTQMKEIYPDAICLGGIY